MILRCCFTEELAVCGGTWNTALDLVFYVHSWQVKGLPSFLLSCICWSHFFYPYVCWWTLKPASSSCWCSTRQHIRSLISYFFSKHNYWIPKNSVVCPQWDLVQQKNMLRRNTSRHYGVCSWLGIVLNAEKSAFMNIHWQLVTFSPLHPTGLGVASLNVVFPAHNVWGMVTEFCIIFVLLRNWEVNMHSCTVELCYSKHWYSGLNTKFVWSRSEFSPTGGDGGNAAYCSSSPPTA